MTVSSPLDLSEPTLFAPKATPLSLAGRKVWGAPSARYLPWTADGWVAWYQHRHWSVADAVHHACEARHHEIEVRANGRTRRTLLDVLPQTPLQARHRAWTNAGRTTGSGPTPDTLASGWDLVRTIWTTNLLCWDAAPDPRTNGPSHEVRKGEWQALLGHYRLAGLRYPVYQDPRALHDRLLQLLERTRHTWGLPASAMGLNGRLTLVLGGSTFPEMDDLTGSYEAISHSAGELHLSMSEPWTAFAHEWFHALDHWFGQHPVLHHSSGAHCRDASDYGEWFGHHLWGREPDRWLSGERLTDCQHALRAWHRACRVRRTWDTVEQGSEHWEASRRTFPERLARGGLMGTSSRSAHERFAQYERGCRQRWARGLKHGDWSWQEEAFHLHALLDKHRPGDVPFNLNEGMDGWEGVFEGVVLLQHQQNPLRFGRTTLRHATAQLHRGLLAEYDLDPDADPDYYVQDAELNAWSFEGACDPVSVSWERPPEHPCSVVRSGFPYAWGQQVDRERNAWQAWLTALRPVMPGWS